MKIIVKTDQILRNLFMISYSLLLDESIKNASFYTLILL
ncbi:hypothetical protein X560_1371 [Listeria fleischmannii 1991]|uniref:Uncharacterized protein n=1 Tax=Listeria fleischmannii 1991 TaxID=1430899 RepID=A0A0J8G9M0_9LIST|nr:hypothetical protein X560_1371 [Listeria fleischmannii 1991]